MYAIAQTGWRAIASANDIQAGEMASETIPQSLLDYAVGMDVRRQRDGLIASCDWTQIPDAPLTAAQRAAWVTYRQALRDVPAQVGFPDTIDWPKNP